MDNRSNLRVVVFPTDDDELRRDVEATVATLPDGLPESAMVATAQERLRHWYRSVQIRPRDSLAGFEDDPTHVWYVYRDGSVGAGSATLDRLYKVLAAARQTRRATERAIDAAHDAGRRTTVDPARRPGRRGEGSPPGRG